MSKALSVSPPPFERSAEGVPCHVPLRLPPDALPLLRCPICGSHLSRQAESLQCESNCCGTTYPIVDGVPILLNEDRSLFSIADYQHGMDGTKEEHQSPAAWMKRSLARIAPDIHMNARARANFAAFTTHLLRQRSSHTRVLVVGGALIGMGMENILDSPDISFVETDVARSPQVALVCDAHDLPFADSSFDGLIITAVLEHVVDPYRCVEEIHRVLKPDGLVYAETPFMQQVHGQAYDFTRFTYLGHRRLFRRFEEIDSGAVCGPGMALAWSCQYFLWSFVRTRAARNVVRAISRLTLFWLKYLDVFLVRAPGGLDAASGYYFLGRRSERTLADRDLIALHKGYA